MEISVPFITNLPLDKLVELRKKEEETFLDFQLFLKNLSFEIDTSKSSEIQKQIQQITQEKLNPIMRKLNREYKRIKNTALIRGIPRGIIAFGTMITSISSGIPILEILGSVASLKLFKDVTDEYARAQPKNLLLKQNDECY